MPHTIPSCYYRISIKALITDDDQKFLLIREGDKRELPGGGLDHGEEPHVCIKREIKEEMGLDIVTVDPYPCYFFTWFKNNKWKSNIVYKAVLEHFDFTPSNECQEIRFFSAGEALQQKLFPNVEKFVHLYQ